MDRTEPQIIGDVLEWMEGRTVVGHRFIGDHHFSIEFEGGANLDILIQHFGDGGEDRRFCLLPTYREEVAA